MKESGLNRGSHFTSKLCLYAILTTPKMSLILEGALGHAKVCQKCCTTGFDKSLEEYLVCQKWTSDIMKLCSAVLLSVVDPRAPVLCFLFVEEGTVLFSSTVWMPLCGAGLVGVA